MRGAVHSINPLVPDMTDRRRHDPECFRRMTEQGHPCPCTCGLADERAKEEGNTRITGQAEDPPEVGWRPIETAPHDGTVVDLWREGRRLPDCWWGWGTPYLKYKAVPQPGWLTIDPGMGDAYRLTEGRGYSITHWMPIPAAPLTKPPQ